MVTVLKYKVLEQVKHCMTALQPKTLLSLHPLYNTDSPVHRSQTPESRLDWSALHQDCVRRIHLNTRSELC